MLFGKDSGIGTAIYSMAGAAFKVLLLRCCSLIVGVSETTWAFDTTHVPAEVQADLGAESVCPVSLHHCTE